MDRQHYVAYDYREWGQRKYWLNTATGRQLQPNVVQRSIVALTQKDVAEVLSMATLEQQAWFEVQFDSSTTTKSN